MILKKCFSCGEYNLSEKCKKCGGETKNAHYKFLKLGGFSRRVLKNPKEFSDS